MTNQHPTEQSNGVAMKPLITATAAHDQQISIIWRVKCKIEGHCYVISFAAGMPMRSDVIIAIMKLKTVECSVSCPPSMQGGVRKFCLRSLRSRNCSPPSNPWRRPWLGPNCALPDSLVQRTMAPTPKTPPHGDHISLAGSGPPGTLIRLWLKRSSAPNSDLITAPFLRSISWPNLLQSFGSTPRSTSKYTPTRAGRFPRY